MGTIRTAQPEASEPEIPAVEPVITAECPYLSADEASVPGGEKTTEVRIDDGMDTPACFFYGADGEVRLTTTVYSVDSAERAAQLVEEAAPAGRSEPSEVEGGWSGGRTESPGGALVVLANDDRVLVVQSTGEETDEVQRVAELVAPWLD